MSTVLFCLVSGIVFGAFMALVAFIPYFRRILRESAARRQRWAIGLGIIAGCIVYIVGAFVLGSNSIISFEEVFSDEEQRVVIQQIYVEGGEAEAWIRHLLPPFLRETCYTGNTEICTQLNDLTPESPWLDYLSLLASALLAGGACYWLVKSSHRPLFNSTNSSKNRHRRS